MSNDFTMAYLGNSRGLERELVPRTGIQTFLAPMAPPGSPRGLLLLALATLRAIWVVGRLRPKVTFATGGYVSAPAALASWLLHVPVVLFLPDVVPGTAVSWLARLARTVAVSNDDARAYFPAGKTVVTGYPVREWFFEVTRSSGRARFGLDHDARVLCVFGGSQGARSVNEALASCLPDLLSDTFVLHVCGEKRLEEAEAAAAGLSREQQSRYRLMPYLHDRDMAEALAASDLVLCRSGASTLGELPILGLPSVLVPLPQPTVHQRENAEYLARHGAAVIVEDSTLRSDLFPILDEIIHDPDRLAGMAAASSSLAHPEAAQEIAAAIASAAS